MTGLLRLVFLGVLLLIALRVFSPLSVPAIAERIPAALVHPVGPFAWFDLAVPPASVLWLVRDLCLLAWFCAAIGLLTTPSLVVTALTALFLHAAGMSIYTAHGWIAPVLTLLCLAAARCGDTWSVDAIIRRRWPAWPGGARPGSVGDSGLARKLVTLICVHTLFAGGVSKLIGGWGLADGETLRFYIEGTPGVWGQAPRAGWLAAFIDARPWLYSAMAAGALLLELSSPLALFSRGWRHLLVVAGLGFHLSIYLLMLPDFWAQAWCYVLLVDWRRPARLPTPVTARSLGAAAAASAAALTLVVVTVRGTDDWVLTSVPMYSSAARDASIADVPRDDFASRDGLTRLARREHWPWASMLLVWPRVEFELAGQRGSVSINEATGPWRFRWVEMSTRLVQQEAAYALLGEDGPRTLDTAAMLDALAAQAARDGVPVGDYRTVRLVYRADDGPVVLFTRALPAGR